MELQTLAEDALERARTMQTPLELIIQGHYELLASCREKLASVTHEEDKYRIFPSGRYMFARGAKHYSTVIRITQFRLQIDQEALRIHHVRENQMSKM